jgi:hypothetical protein
MDVQVYQTRAQHIPAAVQHFSAWRNLSIGDIADGGHETVHNEQRALRVQVLGRVNQPDVFD